MSCTAYNVPIRGFLETSFIDWKGCLSSVLFTGGCNFRCPFCHNPELVLHHSEMEEIPLERVIFTLRKYKKWLHGIVITGGEPTIHKDLFRMIGRIKSEGVKVKLDTNGSSPIVLKGLVAEGLIDYVAMDVKGPVDRYKRWCGVDINTKKIEESIRFILEGTVEYEFRMTVVPFLHREVDVYNTAEYIRHAKRFTIQEFRPHNTLDPSYADIKPFSPDKIAKIRENVEQIMAGGSEQTAVVCQQSAIKRPMHISSDDKM
ncbi:MAG TPA: anaerobic ribonucleoside-triphosphate reductase activating protein [Syntrophorhabdaceae bacterium]|nr:anaerobic ribonucleoside-triphosphate reductase activating protein [Syntrophorhabdaceae bacterium]HQM81894.1 anaerobic ribonucleoside-triphosphate reductase activating protein [Syntrophorhabdaceae bacterium]